MHICTCSYTLLYISQDGNVLFSQKRILLIKVTTVSKLNLIMKMCLLTNYTILLIAATAPCFTASYFQLYLSITGTFSSKETETKLINYTINNSNILDYLCVAQFLFCSPTSHNLMQEKQILFIFISRHVTNIVCFGLFSSFVFLFFF